MRGRFIIKDSYGNTMAVFFSFQSASTYKFTFGNEKWIIIEQ